MKKPRFMLLIIAACMLFMMFSNMALADSFDWRKYEGQSIRFVGLKFYYNDFIAEKLPEFEKLTGIKVNMETYPEDQFRQKVVVELTGGSRDLDVFNTAGTCYEGYKFNQAGWYEPLNNYISNPSLTNPNWDPDDFIPSVANAQIVDGKRIAVPLNAVSWLLIYRKDLYQQYGLNVPKTMEELRENAKKLTQNDVYGYVGRGKRTQSVATWSMFLHAFGGQWLDEKRNPAINSPQAIQALEFYADLMKNYANPGAAENDWYDLQSLLQQGKVAQAIDASAWLGALVDPEKSRISETVSFARMPDGPGGSVADLWSWNLAISSLSQKKGPAWYFVQWATGKEMQYYAQLKNTPTARISAWDLPEFKNATNQEWLKAVSESFAVARPILHPPVVAVSEIEDVIGEAIVNTILGLQDAKSALDQAAQEMKYIMAATE